MSNFGRIAGRLERRLYRPRDPFSVFLESDCESRKPNEATTSLVGSSFTLDILSVMSGEGMSDAPATMEIGGLTDSAIPAVLDVLEESFGGSFDRRWFDWKHRSGPWGPSRGWVATDEAGLVGVRLFMPWRFVDRTSDLLALRPCDTVTVPRARGRGVFRKLTERAIDSLGEDVDFLFNTPNSQSKPGYLKMGFVEWTNVGQAIGVVSPSRAGLTENVSSGDAANTLRTERTPEFIDWRYKRCPVYEYRILALAEGDSPNGIVFRLRNWRGLRVVVVDECWGGPKQEAELIRSAAWTGRTPLVWISETMRASAFISMARASTTVTRFDLGQSRLPEPEFSVGDIESVL